MVASLVKIISVFFGWLKERLGRRILYLPCATLAVNSSYRHAWDCIMVWMMFVRFWLGFGTGYGYPLPATLTATGFSPTSCAIPGLMNGTLSPVVIVTAVSKMFFNLTD